VIDALNRDNKDLVLKIL